MDGRISGKTNIEHCKVTCGFKLEQVQRKEVSSLT